MGFVAFLPSIFTEKSGAQFVFGFGRAEPRSHWVQKGRGLDVPSRLKGIKTGFKIIKPTGNLLVGLFITAYTVERLKSRSSTIHRC